MSDNKRSSLQLSTDRWYLRELLDDGGTEVLKWRIDNATGEGGKEEAEKLLERIRAATAEARDYISVVDHETLEGQMRRLEHRRAKEMLLVFDLMTGDSKDREERRRMGESWHNSSRGKKKQIETYLKKSDTVTGLSEADKNAYQKRLDVCLKPTPQEKDILKAWRAVALYITKHTEGEVKKYREKKLEEVKDGVSLADDIKAARVKWEALLASSDGGEAEARGGDEDDAIATGEQDGDESEGVNFVDEFFDEGAEPEREFADAFYVLRTMLGGEGHSTPE